jgi:hypothetical protein
MHKCACAYKKYCGKLKQTKYLIKNKHLEDGVTRETFKLQYTTVMTLKREMCDLSSRARAFSVEALIGVKRHNNEETGKTTHLIIVSIKTDRH